MAELKVKKERGTNWTAEEINDLIKLIVEEQKTIECKKTDGTTWQDKNAAWERITNSYNACSSIPRTKKNLKNKYEDLKKNIRKKYANNKMEIFKTGGGTANIIALSSVEKTISQMMGSTIEGMAATYDSDIVPGTSKQHETGDSTATDMFAFEELQEDNRILDEFTDYEFLDATEPAEKDTKEEAERDQREEAERDQREEAERDQREEAARRDRAKRGVALLTKPVAPEIRPQIKKRKRAEPTNEHVCGCETLQKAELHKKRLEILDKEFEVTEIKLEAARLDLIIKQKQIKYEDEKFKKLKN